MEVSIQNNPIFLNLSFDHSLDTTSRQGDRPMPYINVKLTAKPDPALSARVARRVSELTRVHLGKDPTVTAVAVDYVDPQHWFTGGRSLAEQETGTFWLDIKVTDSTNTK